MIIIYNLLLHHLYNAAMKPADLELLPRYICNSVHYVVTSGTPCDLFGRDSGLQGPQRVCAPSSQSNAVLSWVVLYSLNYKTRLNLKWSVVSARSSKLKIPRWRLCHLEVMIFYHRSTAIYNNLPRSMPYEALFIYCVPSTIRHFPQL